jgi:eukaryotic-like serine/threonine-protein kinase
VNVEAKGAGEVWMVPMEEGAAARPLLAGRGNARDARLSPAGPWLAYVSHESGQSEVSLWALSSDARRIPVSPAGGDHPVWSREGRELFYVDPEGRLTVVPVRWHGGVPALGTPSRLDVPPIWRGHWGTPYDVSPDGSRIYFLRRNDDPPPREIHVVIGWRALLD